MVGNQELAARITETGQHRVTKRKVTPVGFEPTPLQNGALSHRLRPLGQSVNELDFRRPYGYRLSCSVVSPHLASKPVIGFSSFS